jgi:hypothetical protein
MTPSKFVARSLALALLGATLLGNSGGWAQTTKAAAPVKVAPTATPAASVPASINADASGLALRGYDPVSYFAANGPVRGKPDLTAQYRGATYRFATAANRDAFNADRNKYLPAYGGFCALCLAEGKKVDADPQIWGLAEGKIYLNATKAQQTKWVVEINNHLVLADKAWQQLKDSAPSAK